MSKQKNQQEIIMLIGMFMDFQGDFISSDYKFTPQTAGRLFCSNKENDIDEANSN